MSLSKLKKKELVALAEANEIEVEKGATKADIEAALEEFGIDSAPPKKAESKAERQQRLKAKHRG